MLEHNPLQPAILEQCATKLNRPLSTVITISTDTRRQFEYMKALITPSFVIAGRTSDYAVEEDCYLVAKTHANRAGNPEFHLTSTASKK